MSDGEQKVQPPSDKQPVIDVKTGCWTKYGQRQQWDLWKRTGGFTDDVWEALLAGLTGSAQFSAIFNQFEAMQVEIAELRTELASRPSYDDQIEELRIQIAAAQQVNDNVLLQQEVYRQETEARAESALFSQQASIAGLSGSLYGTQQVIFELNTSKIPEVSPYLYYTDARARAAISATGSISYNSTTGVISYTTPTNSATASALQTARNIAITGDLAWNVNFDGSGNVTAAGTLATVNSNVGTFGAASGIPIITVNGKGLITAVSGVTVIAPAGTLTGTTLNSTVVTSSLTTVGILTGLTVTQTAAAGNARARISNTSGSANSTADLSLDPGNNGYNSRDAVLRATNNGGNSITFDLLLANGGAPASVLNISPTGVVKIPTGGILATGTYTATPGTITGYITIQDSGGTSRKIAVTT